MSEHTLPEGISEEDLPEGIHLRANVLGLTLCHFAEALFPAEQLRNMTDVSDPDDLPDLCDKCKERLMGYRKEHEPKEA